MGEEKPKDDLKPVNLPQEEGKSPEESSQGKSPISNGAKPGNKDPLTGRFLPGNNANPKGRPPGAKSLTTLLGEAIEKLAEGDDIPSELKDKTFAELLVKRILSKAVGKGDTRAIELIFAYLEGKPTQRIEVSGVKDERIGELTDDQLRKIAGNGKQE